MKKMGLNVSLGILLSAIPATLLLFLPPSANAKELLEGSCENFLAVVDKEYSVSPLYSPSDMVYIEDYGIPALSRGAMLREEPTQLLAKLIADAGAAGNELVVASSYRSFYEQSLAHAFYTDLYGTDAGRVSAMPGHSEHQLGITVDFTNAEVGYQINQSFGDTEASQWLYDNAPVYGFVLSYPVGEEDKTGYMWEPWHYRYVGPENAEMTQDSGLDARDLLLEEGVKPKC